MHQLIEASGNVKIAGYMTCPKGCNVNAGGDITVLGTCITSYMCIYVICPEWYTYTYIDIDRGTDYTQEIKGSLSATNVYVTGGYANKATITVSNSAKCKSPSACVGATIQSSGNKLDVEFAGAGSGYGTSVFCPYSGNCTIICSNGGVGCTANNTGRFAWGSTIVYFSRDTNLNIIPKVCGPNYPARDVNVCPEFQRYTTPEHEYYEMIAGLIEAKEKEEDDDFDDYEDIEEMLFENEKEYEVLSATSPSNLNLDMVQCALIGFGFIVMITSGLIVYYLCYGKGNKYETIYWMNEGINSI